MYSSFEVVLVGEKKMKGHLSMRKPADVGLTALEVSGFAVSGSAPR